MWGGFGWGEIGARNGWKFSDFPLDSPELDCASLSSECKALQAGLPKERQPSSLLKVGKAATKTDTQTDWG